VKHIGSIPIAGIHTSITWTREEMPDDCRDDYGHTEAGRRSINVNSEFCGSEFAAESTLFHEVIHAALAYTGHSELLESLGEKAEEALVLALEYALHPAICEMVAAGAFRHGTAQRHGKAKR
jgi:hypothetical protein